MKFQKENLAPIGLALTGLLKDTSAQYPNGLSQQQFQDLTGRLQQTIKAWPSNPSEHTETLLDIVQEIKDIGAPASALGRANADWARGVTLGASYLEDDLNNFRGGQGPQNGGGSAPTPRPFSPSPIYSQSSSQGGYQPEREKKGLYS